ncbi:MAG: xanthine dehydrogenase family protein molybdopterin-binding subunit [Chloroflexi bacterium]|nr:xanthine dehydrogenase family protein molybdopterin-binding subunit [Chloroflexota bacterium]
MTTTYRSVHQRQPRLEGAAKVTGGTVYTADLRLHRMVHAKALRAPYAHALIKRLDVSKARAYPGVVGVFTAADLPQHLPRDGANRLHTVLADKEVMYYGQPVAAVVADEASVAEEALDLIEVEYQELPAVLDILDALKQDAPPVRHSMAGIDRSELAAHTTLAAADEQTTEKTPPNVTHRMVWSRGDVERAFKEADVVVERSFRASWTHQGYIEPMSGIVDCDRNGDYTVWTSTQGDFTTREGLAKVLGVPETKVRVNFVEMGGGFGAKIQPFGAVLPAIIARILRRPVKYIFSRSEDLRSADPSSQAYIETKLAAKKDGAFTAFKARAVYDSGSFPGSPLMAGANLLGAYYKFPNLEIEGLEVITNRVSQGALRAPGTPQATFAIESTVDIMAKELGMDPLELRIKNAVTQGDLMPNGRAFSKIGLVEVLQRFKETSFWKNRNGKPSANGKKVGVGFAVGGWLGGGSPSSASVELNADGTVSVMVGANDVTGTNTSFAQIVSEALGLPIERINVKTGDTSLAPYAGVSAGSKTLRTVGLSVQRAAQDALDQMFKIVSERLECSSEDLESVDGQIRVKGSPEKAITFELLGTMSTGFGSPTPVILGRGNVGTPAAAPGFTIQGAKVEVDPETGEVNILDAVCVQDVGFAINPLSVEGQIQGGVAQSLGLGFSEEMVWDDKGVLRNPTLLDYRIPTALDLPRIETALVEVPVEGAGPYGAKGVGEPPIAAGAAALVNAVSDAVGARVYTLPATSERILAALGKLPG